MAICEQQLLAVGSNSGDFLPEMQSFEQSFLSVLDHYGLPSSNIFIPVSERIVVFKNADTVMSQIPTAKRASAIYFSKFLAACANGLFDAALNYLWDETIQEIRKRVMQYDLEYFYENATNEDKRKRLKTEDDIIKLDDSELIQGARRIGLISEIGYRHLDNIRYMRNWASAAHPNQNELTGLMVISWLEICIKEVISLPISNIAIEIRKLLSNVKSNSLTQEEAKLISSFFIDFNADQSTAFAQGLLGLYADPSSTEIVRQNINYLIPFLWPCLIEDTKVMIGIRYGKYIANNDKERADLVRRFLDTADGASYIPDNIRGAEIDIAVEGLLSAHRASGNFYSEPMCVRQLENLIGQTGQIPSVICKKYVMCLVEVLLTNGHGVAWNAEPTYVRLVQSFNQDESILAMLSFDDENIASRLQFPLCQKKYRELLSLISGKISSPAPKMVLEQINIFTGPLDKMRYDSKIKRSMEALKVILQKY